jgi:hypothetical protein
MSYTWSCSSLPAVAGTGCQQWSFAASMGCIGVSYAEVFPGPPLLRLAVRPEYGGHNSFSLVEICPCPASAHQHTAGLLALAWLVPLRCQIASFLSYLSAAMQTNARHRELTLLGLHYLHHAVAAAQ